MKQYPVLAFASLLALGACTTTTPEAAAPSPSGNQPPMAASGCDADAANASIGKAGTPESLEQARVAAGAQVARILKPGQVVTMEYHGSRLNMMVDENGVVMRLTCG